MNQNQVEITHWVEEETNYYNALTDVFPLNCSSLRSRKKIAIQKQGSNSICIISPSETQIKIVDLKLNLWSIQDQPVAS